MAGGFLTSGRKDFLVARWRLQNTFEDSRDDGLWRYATSFWQPISLAILASWSHLWLLQCLSGSAARQRQLSFSNLPMCGTATAASFEATSGKLQRLLHFAQAAGHGDALAVMQNDDVLAFEHRLEFFDVVEVDDGAAADAEKLLGIELGFEGTQGLAEDVAFFADVDCHVVTGGFDGFDVGGFHDEHLLAGLYGDACEVVGGGWGRCDLTSREEVDEAAGSGGGVPVGEMGAGTSDGGFEAGGFEGFEQVIERVRFKGSDGVLIVGGGENDERQIFARDFFQEFEAVHLGHLDIEKEQVGRVALDGGEGIVAAGTFTDDGEFRFIDREKLDALSGERFVVNDEGSEIFHVGRGAAV